VHNNIAYGHPDARHAVVEQAARNALAHGFIMTMPQGYATVIGEKGFRLSGGERQRIAIARALLRRPHLFIFDEATSSLDSLTERDIGDTIRALAGHSEAITILIAHRLSTVSHANVIYVLDRGRVVESGSHADLVAAGGLYRDMWLQQVTGDGDAPSAGDATLSSRQS
jgi:ATP-binding cassette subfamily B protein